MSTGLGEYQQIRGVTNANANQGYPFAEPSRAFAAKNDEEFPRSDAIKNASGLACFAQFLVEKFGRNLLTDAFQNRPSNPP